MRYPIIAIITAIGVVIAGTLSAQTARSDPEIPPNALVTIANGVQLILVPWRQPQGDSESNIVVGPCSWCIDGNKQDSSLRGQEGVRA